MISKNNSNVPAAALTKGDFCYIILIEINAGGGAKMLEGYAMTIVGKSKSDNTDNFCINGKIRFDAEDKYLAAWDDVTHKKNVYAVFSGRGSEDMAATAAFIGASVAEKCRKKDLAANFEAFSELLNGEICDYIFNCDGVRVALLTSVLCISGKSVSAFNIGGGTVLLLRNGKLKSLVKKNESFAGSFEEEGGCGFERSQELTLEDGDSFAVCCEAVVNAVPENELAEIMKNEPSAKKAAAAIIRKAMENGAEEALTAAVVKYTDAPEKKQGFFGWFFK